jgi:hypothetical protein
VIQYYKNLCRPHKRYHKPHAGHGLRTPDLELGHKRGYQKQSPKSLISLVRCSSGLVEWEGRSCSSVSVVGVTNLSKIFGHIHPFLSTRGPQGELMAGLPLKRRDCDSIKKKITFAVAYWLNLQFVMALLPKVRPLCDDDSPWIECCRFFPWSNRSRAASVGDRPVRSIYWNTMAIY